MTELGLQLPPRNLLTGSVAPEWVDEQADALSGLTLAWRDLSVYRRRRISRGLWRSPRYEELKVLNGVSGVATQGNLVAIMGASGAGKTTLLAAISRRERADTSGSHLLNGRPVSATLVANISGFVPQQDLAIADLNVAEHMTFMARLMMDRRSTSGCRARRIQQLLTELNVASCANTKLRLLSGGERKRISLAVQLLNDPAILFCDEPTSGLDSWAASAVITRLCSLATSGKMVICSIHQPTSGVFEMFHKVIFLAGGRVAFQGSVDQAASFFSGLGYKCPVGFNQAEYYVSQLSIEAGNELKSHERIRRICDEFRRSKISAEIMRQLDFDREYDKLSSSSSVFDTGGPSEFEPFERYLTLKKVSCFVQFNYLMWRNILEVRRNYSGWAVEFILFLSVGLMVAIPYMGITSSFDQRDIQNVEGLMYLTVAETIFTFLYSVFMTFPLEMPVLLREIANDLYSPTPYYLAKIIFWIPRAVITSLLYSSLIFFVVGLNGGLNGWLWFSFICTLCANSANAYGSFLSATFESMETAALVSVPVDLMGTMFSGIFLNLASLPPTIAWIKYLSMFYHGTEAISVLQWETITNIKCVDVPGTPCIKTGAEVLARFGFAEENLWFDVLGLSLMYFAYNLIAYTMLRRRSRRAPVY